MRTDSSHQSGNVVLALFGAVVLLGGIGYGYTSLIKGPARGVNTITQRTASETDIFQAANILVASARQNQPSDGDCDGDNYFEPLPWRAAGGAPAPTGGGLIPTGTPAVMTDSWGNTFGYCAWDHGTIRPSHNNAGCGGSAALRREGGDVKTEEVIAVISSGPDRIFQTSCSNYVNPSTPMLVRTPGSDDIFVSFTYAEAFDAAGVSGGGLGDVDDGACTVDSIGLMRYEQEVVQVCLDDGAGGAEWKEVGAGTAAIPDFTPTINADPSTQYTSNTISFTGFHGTRTTTVDNGGVLVINGTPSGSSAQVAVGDTVAIRATSSATLGAVRSFTLAISSITRVWTLQTRDPLPATFSISPSGPTDMDVGGPGNPALGTQRTFTITNTGEVASGAVNAAVLSNNTNFTITGDNCDPNASIAPAASCTVFVRPQATADGPFSGTLTVSAVSTVNGVANLSGTASGFSCINVGGYCWYLGADNESCDAVCAARGGYNTATDTYSGANGTLANCQSVLVGLSAGTGSAADTNMPVREKLGCFITTSNVRTRGYLSGTPMTTSNGNQSGVRRACACNLGSACMLDGQTVPNGGSHTFYSAANDINCASISQSRTCTNGVLDGSGTYQYANCVNNPCPGGALVGGYCFYLGSGGQSCNTVCSAYGGYNTATVSYGGGSVENCQNVLEELGGGFMRSQANSTGSCTQPFGCAVTGVATRVRCTSSSAGGSHANALRACACGTMNTGSCNLDRKYVANGASDTFYSERFSSNCAAISQSRTCTNSALSGSSTYKYSSCAVTTCANGGVSVGGYCWYQGDLDESCNTVCASRGGYNAATQTYAGSSGTLANCAAVLDALYAPVTPPVDSACGLGLGCTSYFGSTWGNRRCTDTTTASGETSVYRRVCACNN